MLKSMTLHPLFAAMLFAYSTSGYVAENQIRSYYIGPKIGGVFNTVHLNAQHLGLANISGRCDKRNEYSSFNSGLQAGYNYYMAPNLMFGIEGDYTRNSKKQTRAQCNCDPDVTVSDRFTFDNRYQGSIRGRLGYQSERYQFLPFIIAGASFANLRMTYTNEGQDYYRRTSTKSGWLVGAGLEKKFFKNGLVRLDYTFNHYDRFNMPLSRVYQLVDASGKLSAQLYNHNIAGTLSYTF